MPLKVFRSSSYLRISIFAEIFFHFSEAEGDIELRPGDDVEFTIQTKNVRNFEIRKSISVINSSFIFSM